jgi:hypothetical protein
MMMMARGSGETKHQPTHQTKDATKLKLPVLRRLDFYQHKKSSRLIMTPQCSGSGWHLGRTVAVKALSSVAIVACETEYRNNS